MKTAPAIDFSSVKCYYKQAMELARFTSRGGLSVRSIFVFVLAVVLTALLCTALSGAKTHAQSPEGFWKGDTITYDLRQYYPAGAATQGQSHNLPVGSEYYLAVEEISEAPLVRKAHVIYFAPGTDPPKATSATYLVYEYSEDEEFSSPAGRTSVEMTPAGEEGTETASSCTVEGIGWIICPVSVWLASAMDNIYNMISDLVVVPPIAVNKTDSPLYTAWNVMRSFANLAFIIVFVIIIYSQLTSIAVDKYGLKKLTPRLIVAAVLVNISFFVCALAVDLSNLAGYGLQHILIDIRQDTFAITGDTWSSNATNTWSTLTAFILSGGTAAGAFIGFSIATAGSIGAAIYLLIPILIGLALAVFVALLVLAARQAIIIILIVVAPLAFVANLLPNTEKWFERWKDLFMTMLIFFPAFSLVFGGSQLAGGIIIQNANNILMMIFGLAVQVAPLVITPLLLKLSGGLLNRIAGVVNDPGKGFLDKTKNWAGDRAGYHRAKSMGDDRQRRWYNPNRYNAARGTARFFDGRRRNVQKGTEVYEKMAETRYMDKNRRYAQLADLTHEAETDHKIVENRHEQRAQGHINHAGSPMQLKHTQMEAGKLALERAVQVTDANTAEFKAGTIRPELADQMNARARSTMNTTVAQMSSDREALNVERARLTSADGIQQQLYAEAMETNIDLQVRAGGIDPKGAQRALAAALAAQNKAHGEAISNASSILTHYNYGDDVVADIALGTRPAGVNINITDDIREAAISQIAGGGNTDEIIRLMRDLEINTSDANQDFRQTFADRLLANSGKPKFAGAGIIAQIKQGEVPIINGAPATGKARLDNYIVQTMNANKLSSAELLVTQDRSYLEAVRDTLLNNESGLAMDPVSVQKLRDAITLAKEDADYSGRIGERTNVLDEIQRLIGG